jgi:acyl carrier protein
MTEKQFIQGLQEEVFTETNPELISLKTNFKDLDEWDSLVSLCLIAYFDMNLGKKISGDQIKNSNTIQDLYNIFNL